MAYTRQCDRCKRIVAPRGNSTPRFCPVCGARLTGGPVQLPSVSITRAGRVSGMAVAALVLGIISLPASFCGMPLGLIAISCGVVAKQRINQPLSQLSSSGLATAGIILGIVSSILHLLICLGMV